MFPVTTNMAGQCMAMPDVCLTPAPPAPPIPVPYPNIAMVMQATAPTCSLNVKIMNKPVCSKITMISTSTGDEAGANMGVASGMIKGPCQYSMGSTMVTVEGQAVVYLGSPTRQNGVSANAPMGTQIAPSQTMVTVGG